MDLYRWIMYIHINRVAVRWVVAALCMGLFPTSFVHAKEYHVSVDGSDAAEGTFSKPFRTIAYAARIAQPGDTVTVHEGTYREWINPTRGGTCDTLRIVYRAAEGEQVEIKGSEVIPGKWERTETKGVWKIVIPNAFFGDHNPYQTVVEGDWYVNPGWPRHTGEVFLNGVALCEQPSLEQVAHVSPDSTLADPDRALYAWYCESDEHSTTLWANFQKENPNRELVEISVRRTCFYPSKPGINYITISGFRFSQAATQWPAPTAEQIGMIATNWNKGWIIENNVIHDSKCAGITLGKERSTGHNVWSANPVFDGSLHYIEVIFKTLRNGWNREHIGSHVVRNNTIYDCGQSGICGSMGAAFSRIVGNHIYNIASNKQLKGPELGGIKFHGAIDVLIQGNRIHHTEKGLFLDWMTQGTRISGNLFYDNVVEDLYMEVNHGPYIVDNNIFGSPFNLWDMSDGGAFVHNLFLGKIRFQPELSRYTPYHLPHSTEVAGISIIIGGDDRFYNNVFLPSRLADGEKIAGSYGLADYAKAGYPVTAGGNAYFAPAQPFPADTLGGVRQRPEEVVIEETADGVFIVLPDVELPTAEVGIVRGDELGQTVLAKTGYENPDGSSVVFDTDYFGQKRSESSLVPGPFTDWRQKNGKYKIW